MPESPAATERRRRHERQLEAVGGPGTDAGQRLLDRWHREQLASYRGRVTDKVAQPSADTEDSL